jgi:phosphoglycerate-specific signal transduction histidine kinase
LREATLAALHELTERLTAITNYLAAALRLSQSDATAAGISLRHAEILEKAFDQVAQADEAIKRLRRLLDEDARGTRTPSAGE